MNTRTLICLFSFLQFIILSPSLYGLASPHIYVNSIPKCGTHLLAKCITLLTKKDLIELPKDLVTNNQLPQHKKNEFFATHVPYSQKASQVFKKGNYKTFLIYRDPRDKIMSRIHFMQRGGWNRTNINTPFKKMSIDRAIELCIYEIKKEYDAYLPWFHDPSCCVIRFENLVGPKGGGTLDAQIKEIQKIARHINVPLSNTRLQYCINNIFGGTVTFSNGKIGNWKKFFKPYHVDLFKHKANDLLLKLNYETDDTWHI